MCWWKISNAESLTNETATTLQLYLAQMDLAAIFNGMYVYFIAGPRQGLIRCRSNVNNRNRNSYPRNRICQIYKASAVHEWWPGFCPNNTRSQVSANRKVADMQLGPNANHIWPISSSLYISCVQKLVSSLWKIVQFVNLLLLLLAIKIFITFLY